MQSEDEQNREPGEPGTSLPVLDSSLVSPATAQPLLTPMTVVSRPLVSTPTSANRPPTKLRRIEPKPLPGVEASPTPPSASVPHASQAMTVPLTFVTVPQVPQQFHIQPQTLQQQQQQQIQAQQLQLQQQIQLQPQLSQVTTHPQILQSPVHIDPSQQPQLLSPGPLQQLSPQHQTSQPQPQLQISQQSPVSKKEEKRKEKQKQQQQLQQQQDQLVKDVKEEYDGDDAVSSSSHVTRFINASVQTPNKLLRMVAEEICGQSARKPHADRDFKVGLINCGVIFLTLYYPGIC